MNRPTLLILVLATGTLALFPACLVGQWAHTAQFAQGTNPIQNTPTYPALEPAIWNSRGDRFFPVATLIGTAIGAAAATLLLVAAGEGDTLLPTWRERGFLIGSVGLGAAIGFSIDLDRRAVP